MSIVLIQSARCGSYGYQARAHVRKGHPALTRFFAFGAHGGADAAYRKAQWQEVRLKAQARRLRKALP
jgi:hypothetical protein